MGKVYYWLKLHDDFFTRKEIKKLRSIAGGDTYTIIYLKLLLLAMKSDGYIYFDNIEDDIISELALEIDEIVDNVRIAMLTLEKLGLAKSNIDNCYFTEIPKMTGKETDSARRVRKHRDSNALQCNSDVTFCNTEKEIEREKEIEKEREIEKKPANSSWKSPYSKDEIIDSYLGTYNELQNRNLTKTAWKKIIIDHYKKFSEALKENEFATPAECMHFIRKANFRYEQLKEQGKDPSRELDTFLRERNISVIIDWEINKSGASASKHNY